VSSPAPAEAKPKHTTIPHLPALDGLRGLAVLGVLLFHDERLAGGYLGVDLFFVLSGYLITSLLLAEHRRAGSIDLATFWVRRARRLFPALLALVPLVALYSFFFAPGAEHSRIRGDGIATLCYVANWHSVYGGRSYWDMFRAPSPLEHTWSLAIEEQFYVLWPLLSYAVLRFSKGSRRAMLVLSLGLAAPSLAAMVWLGSLPGGSARAYMGTDTRGAAILLGAALACILAERGLFESARKIRALDALGFVATLVLGAAWVFLEGQDTRLYRGGFFVTELCVLVLIACAAHGEKSRVARVFSAKPLAAVGLVSYGLYLYHWPLYVLLSPERTGLARPLVSLARFAATFAVSYASYRLLEQPIRKHGLPFGKPIVVLPVSVAAVVSALVVGTPNVPIAKKVLADLPWPRVIPEGTMKVLVVGDSVAQALGERMRTVDTELGAIVAERGTPNCSILEGKLPTRSLTNEPHAGGNCAARWVSDAETVKPDVTLVVLGGGHFAPVEIDGRWQKACEEGWMREYGAELESDLKKLAGKGGQVFVTKVPYPVGGWFKPGRNEMVDCLNQLVEAAAKKVPGVKILDLGARICPGGVCEKDEDGEPIRPDGLHFGGAGAKKIARWTLGQLKE
jgi:peptidoglycan/LPS O-acetylase OafA/YrhL